MQSTGRLVLARLRFSNLAYFGLVFLIMIYGMTLYTVAIGVFFV
ncbi:putative membrane protein [Yersinia ruckeri ATCC 29473]|uniref:Uncharacterized protein n=1 Tax=Yersinia ruckeri TaxID=29486 RepID=A0A380QQC0_YERRU|nr:hypothetical protein QMA0440_03504 [Yersinia ruckeri]KGA47021.1 putative membrane protein [Yersinia ruckeri ATCC 29473]CNC02592.1 Uncharacterised protein [Yersinia ruckeri]SUQ00832.1 Uncharacterised protein [Yersinia ruckeri]